MRILFSNPNLHNDSAVTSSANSLESIFQKYGMEDENFVTSIFDEGISIEVERVYRLFPHKKNFVHIGMGGSSLGPKMLIKSLGCKSDVQFHFLDNSDPDSVISVLNECHLPETLFYVVSKSGTTAETIAILSLVIRKLKENAISSSHWRDYLVFCTNSKEGDLKAMADDFDLATLFIPEKVGGRFSVLSGVGLFPAKFANINMGALLKGAQDALVSLREASILSRDLYRLVEAVIYCRKTYHISETVIMPYCDRLKSFNDWFTQLWAETLGKDGIGLTPLSAVGASDQHAQMQLFMDGPRDKFFIFVQNENFTNRTSMDCGLSYPSFQKLSHFNLSDLIQCQLRGTLAAMAEKGIPHALITLESLDEYQLGQLIVFFKNLTTIVGHRLEINPFNQPGVEKGKRYAFQFLEALT